MVFRSDVDMVIAIMRRAQRVNEKKLAELIDAKSVELAHPKTVKVTTGYSVGGVSPVGHDHQEAKHIRDGPRASGV